MPAAFNHVECPDSALGRKVREGAHCEELPAYRAQLLLRHDDEVANDPMDEWAKRAALAAKASGWAIGHTGLVKCAKCAA